MDTTTAPHLGRAARHGWLTLHPTGVGGRAAAAMPLVERALWALLRDHDVSRRPVLAAEERPTYTARGAAADAERGGSDAEPVAANATGAAETDGPPLGLPVLAEVPRLGSVLQALTDADRLMVGAVLGLVELRQSDEVASTTGVPLEHWLGIVAKQTRMDRRLLVRLCGHLERFPALRAAAEQGRVSFAQLRGVSLKLTSAPTVIDADLDRWLAATLDSLETAADPDVLVGQVEQAIVELAPVVVADAEQQAGWSRSMTFMPRLDGSGGKVIIDEDALRYATLDEATAPRPGQLDGTRGIERIRADNLHWWLTHTCTPDPDEAADGDSYDGGEQAAAGSEAAAVGAAAGGTPPLGSEAATLSDAVTSVWGRRALPQIKLLARISFESLLDRSQTPADLLTRLVGGRLRLTAARARELIDARGAELRAIIVDEFGDVVGVGRQTRVPAGWLRDATLALHDTCSGPLCDLPARDAQLDHAIPWWPTGPGEPYGTTDVDNIGPLHAGTNRDKERAGWKAVQTANGQRTWHHPRSGLTVTTVPATWRPPGFRMPKRPRDRHHPRGDPSSGLPGRAGALPSGTDPPGDPPGDLPGDPPGDPPGTGPPGAARSPHPPDVDLDDDGRPMPF